MKERKNLINEFQKWLDTNPNKNIIASECATIAERYAQQKVNEVLDEAYKNIYMQDLFFEKLDLEDLKILKNSILKLKNNEK